MKPTNQVTQETTQVLGVTNSDLQKILDQWPGANAEFVISKIRDFSVPMNVFIYSTELELDREVITSYSEIPIPIWCREEMRFLNGTVIYKVEGNRLRVSIVTQVKKVIKSIILIFRNVEATNIKRVCLHQVNINEPNGE